MAENVFDHCFEHLPPQGLRGCIMTEQRVKATLLLTKMTSFRQNVKSNDKKVLKRDEGKSEIRGVANLERRENQGVRYTVK